MTTTEAPKAAPETAAPQTTSTNGEQPSGQAAVATAGDTRSKVDDAYSTFAYDNLPPAIWQHIRAGVETGAVPVSEVERWRAEASERHRIEARLRRERGELLRAHREQPQESKAKPADPAPPSTGLRAKLGQEADQLEPTVVDAIEAWGKELVERATARPEPQRPQISREEVLAKQVARLGERFPGLKDAQRAPALMEEIESWVFSLAQTKDPRLLSGQSYEERLDRLFDAASELVAREVPYLRRGLQPLPPEIPPSRQADAPRSEDNGIGAPRSKPLAEMSFEERQVAAANWAVRNPGQWQRAREMFGLPS